MSSAKVRVGGNAASSEARPRSMLSSELGSSATVVAQARGLRGERAEEGVEVDDQFAQLLLVHVQRRGHFADARDQLGEVVRFGAAERLVDDRAAAQRGRPALGGLVERLRRVQAAHVGVLFGVFGGVRLARQPVAVADQEVLQVGARVGVQRVQHLVELDRVGGLRDRQRGAGGERLRRRAAGLQFDEPVAFQEDPRADLRGRVGVDRQAPRFDFHAHQAGVALGA